MNNKGFTLIEVVAVVAILVAIFLVSFPTITTLLNNEEETKYNTMVNTLCEAGETYIYLNMGEYSELSTIDSEIIISVNSLIEEELVDKNLINPKSQSSIRNDNLKYKVLMDYSLECKYVEG